MTGIVLSRPDPLHGGWADEGADSSAHVISQFSVPSMHCAGCIAKLEGGMRRLPFVKEARVHFGLKRIRVTHDSSASEDDVAKAIDALGFRSERLAAADAVEAPNESRALLKALGVAAFASMNVMLLAVSVWSGADETTRNLFHWLSALIAVPAIAYAGQPFFRNAWSALRHMRTNMDVPISVGIIMATVYSLYETIVGGPHAYFDGSLMLIFFLLCGRVLDASMRRRAHDSVTALHTKRPSRALVLGRDGTSMWRAAEELAPGMHILVAAGERCAADGIVVDGTSHIDRSLVTGESTAIEISAGSEILAGMMNMDAPVTVRITAAGEDTALADIARLMEAATQNRSRYVRIADRAARLYTPFVHSVAALAFFGWLLAGADIHQAVMIAVAVLIITCPCALGLAVPVAQVVAVGALARRGIVVKDASALERMAEADIALFDKTGTLTVGRPIPAAPFAFTAQESAAALALSRATRHPLAQAVTAALEPTVKAAVADDIKETAGLGVEARIDGKRARLGKPEWLGLDAPSAQDSDMLHSGFHLEGGSAHLLSFRDATRPEAAETISTLSQMGMEARILSGDAAHKVGALSGQLGISAHADMSPAAKTDAIRAATTEGHHVLMVGDGLNDGPALREAHVSMAPASASDVGQAAADFLFLGDSLLPVAYAVKASRKTMRVIRQNIAIAITYNCLAVPLALAGLVTPLVAAVAMSCSSVVVVSNALRLRSAAS